MAEKDSKKRWATTGVQFLVKHSSGTYYARGYRAGKQVWHSLGTTQISVAKARLSEWLQEHRRRATASIATSEGRMTMEDALGLHLTALAENVGIKESTAVRRMKSLHRIEPSKSSHLGTPAKDPNQQEGFTLTGIG